MLSTPTAPAPVPDLPPVQAGNVCDAKALRARLQTLLASLERADETLLRLVAQAQANRIFMVLEDEHGRFFRDWTSFATSPVPWGLGLSPALVDELARESVDPARRARLVMDAPLILRYRGGQPGHAPTRGPGALTRAGAPRKRRGIHGADYQLQRLKRDFPHLLEQVADGRLPSIAAAAKVAGIYPQQLRVLANPMAVARLIVCHFDPPQQREIVRLVECPAEITAPPGANSAAWKAYRARTADADR